jgi:vacuolar iron transporter family protein
MAAGEYVSVSSQSDTEDADMTRERKELLEQPDFELNELTESFVSQGINRETALEVARQLTAADAIAAHAREELGISEITAARPLQAAITSALTFSAGAALPLGIVLIEPASSLILAVTVGALIFLAILGTSGALAGGANILKATLRVTFWGTIAMAITAGVGAYFGAVV